ncbi:hypothetical protein B566_EDAN006081 [Ephemera danica]|nr:hypothetical protein B566_EDAN006081 [Ephemera danica]
MMIFQECRTSHFNRNIGMEWQVLVFLMLACYNTLHLTSAGDTDLQKYCHDDAQLTCPQARRGTFCHCMFNVSMQSARCCHVDLRRLDDEIASCTTDKRRPTNLRKLFLSNCTADNDELNLKILGDWFPNLETIALNDGGYSAVKDPDSHFHETFRHLKCLNLSNNVILKTDSISKIIDAVPSLSVVDMSDNNLTYVPQFKSRTHTLWLDITGNKQLKCDAISEAIQKNATFLKNNETTCKPQSSFGWFNSTDHMTIYQLEAREKVKADCPEFCLCTTRKIYGADASKPFYAAAVECVGQQLQEMPQKLPQMTYYLNVSNNNKWLIESKRYIPDHDEIFCKDLNQKPVMLLDVNDVCLAEDTLQHQLIYYLIGTEIALLLLLVGKVSYDYWVFKNAGYLPWPASKMPKLPCDCVLERMESR